MNPLITTDQLKTATGYDRPGDIEKCLRKNGVRVLYGKGGKIFTTLDAINSALGVKSGGEEDETNEIEWE